MLLQKFRPPFGLQNASHLIAFGVTLTAIYALHRIRRSELSFRDYRPQLTDLGLYSLVEFSNTLVIRPQLRTEWSAVALPPGKFPGHRLACRRPMGERTNQQCMRYLLPGGRLSHCLSLSYDSLSVMPELLRVAPLEGLEPPTYRVEAGCSIH